MGSLAVLAREMGFEVTGSDQSVYPPMSDQLERAGITLMQGYEASHLQPHPDIVVVGNALKRGIPAIEYMLDQGLKYTSGPQFLADFILPGKHVLAVAGTHGKTTTTTMLASILEHAGKNPGFLIGGVPQGFDFSARLGGDYFVVEADEYDSAFFDKRSKFVHYRPTTAILNNLEFDHADIFDDLKAIQKQFHHLVRTIPGKGKILSAAGVAALDEVLAMGCWSAHETCSADPNQSAHAAAQWQATCLKPDGSAFEVSYNGQRALVEWGLTGQHNVQNGLAAVAAAHHVGVSVADGCAALCNFAGVKRRMELLGTVNGVEVYDDFAHHPTAISTTLEGMRKRIGKRKLWAIIEPRSNTMRMGHHQAHLAVSTSLADAVIWYQPKGLDWDLQPVIAQASNQAVVMDDIATIVQAIASQARHGDVVVVMSNGGFGGIHQQILTALAQA